MSSQNRGSHTVLCLEQSPMCSENPSVTIILLPPLSLLTHGHMRLPAPHSRTAHHLSARTKQSRPGSEDTTRPIAQFQGYAGGSTVRTCCWSPGLAAGRWQPQAFNILEKLPSAHFLSLRFVLCGWALIPSVPSSLWGHERSQGKLIQSANDADLLLGLTDISTQGPSDEVLLQACISPR